MNSNSEKETPAFCGGDPVRRKPLHYSHQSINEDDIKAVDAVLRSDFLTCGPKITEMEEKLCKITGAKYAVACSNDTAALHMACLAIGIKEGDEVITTPITFAASANCALYCGGTPVFADIDPKTYQIDPEDIERKITSHTKAVVAVDYTGQSVKIDEIKEICKKHGLYFIEDAAHSLGTKYKGQPIGSLADISCMSFHAIKTVTGGEGGAAFTNDEEIYKKLLLFRSHGITRDQSLMHHESEGPWYYEMVDLAPNYRLTDMQAALISSQLDRLPQFAARRKAIKKRYDEAFSELPQLFVQKEIPESDTVRHLYILRIKPETLKINRRQFFDAMAAENIICNVNYIPVYRLPYYEEHGYQKGLCPNAEKLYDEMMSIPFYSGMTDSDVEDVIFAVQKIVKYYSK